MVNIATITFVYFHVTRQRETLCFGCLQLKLNVMSLKVVFFTIGDLEENNSLQGLRHIFGCCVVDIFREGMRKFLEGKGYGETDLRTHPSHCGARRCYNRVLLEKTINSLSFNPACHAVDGQTRPPPRPGLTSPHETGHPC